MFHDEGKYQVATRVATAGPRGRNLCSGRISHRFDPQGTGAAAASWCWSPSPDTPAWSHLDFRGIEISPRYTDKKPGSFNGRDFDTRCADGHFLVRSTWCPGRCRRRNPPTQVSIDTSDMSSVLGNWWKQVKTTPQKRTDRTCCKFKHSKIPTIIPAIIPTIIPTLQSTPPELRCFVQAPELQPPSGTRRQKCSLGDVADILAWSEAHPAWNLMKYDDYVCVSIYVNSQPRTDMCSNRNVSKKMCIYIIIYIYV